MDDDEEAYLEYRKRDPAFQKMVEEEMRRLTMELENELGGDLELFTEPVANMKEKKQNVYSPKKPFASVVEDDDDVMEQRRGSNNNVDPYASKREKQELYARQLRQQDEKSLYVSTEPERVSLRSQKNRPTSPDATGTSMLLNIGNHERSKQSPDVKRRQQEEYAKQLFESSKLNAPASKGVNSGKYPAMDSLDSVLGNSSMNGGALLGSIQGVRNNMPSTGGIKIGNIKTDDEVINEKRRKQLEYAKQLDFQKEIDYTVRDSRGKSVPSPKSSNYQTMQEQFKKENSNGTGFNIGDTSGRRSGGPSRRDSVNPQEEEERRLKYEKQRLYAEAIANAASAAPITISNAGNASGRGHSGRRRQEALEGVPTGGMSFSQDAKAADKRLAQQAYNRQLQEASTMAPIESSRVSLKKGPMYGTEPVASYNIGEDRSNSASSKKLAQQEYFRQIQDAANKAPIEGRRVSLRNKNKFEEEDYSANNPSYANSGYNAPPNQPRPPSYGNSSAPSNYQAAAAVPNDLQENAMKIARERILRLRLEAEEEDRRNQQEAEEKYYAYKKSLENPPAEESAGRYDGKYSAREGETYGKYSSGGGGDRSGYRVTSQDSQYREESYPGQEDTTEDQYTKVTYKRHSDAPNSQSSGVIGRYSQPQQSQYQSQSQAPTQMGYPEDADDYSKRDNRMQSVLSIGYNDNSYSGSGMDSGRLSGRRSEVTYNEDVYDPRAAKRQQQQQYRDEIAQAASAAPIEQERYAKFRSERENHGEGINLPGNNHGMYGASGYSDPHSHYNTQGNSSTGYRNVGNSSGGGKSSFMIG